LLESPVQNSKQRRHIRSMSQPKDPLHLISLDTDSLNSNSALIQSGSVTNRADSEALVLGGCDHTVELQRNASHCSVRIYQQAA
jgi:hypothetical protein